MLIPNLVTKILHYVAAFFIEIRAKRADSVFTLILFPYSYYTSSNHIPSFVGE
jgi:hypothetical protein